jgi:hypothetical protein
MLMPRHKIHATAETQPRPAIVDASKRRRARTPEQMMADLFARISERTPADFAAVARAQGIAPVTRLEDLMGEGPADGDEFDVDAFLAARKEWQAEARPFGADLAEPDHSSQ